MSIDALPDIADQLLDYEARVASQIDQYADTVDMHELPEIFHVWSHNYLRPQLEAVFGSASVTDFYADAFLATSPRGRGRILSIGCGYGTIEIEVARRLREKGVDFELIGTDISPVLLDRMRKDNEAAGLADCVFPMETDLNNIALDGEFDLIMAQHSLHHILALEQLFDFAKAALTEHGIFATQDMIGRNGHQRWPEARAILEAIWPTLSEEQRYHSQLKRLDLTFRDHDCSGEGFEGIRAQDVLPLLLERFHPARFVAGGGFIDLLVDRGYGHGWDAKNEQHIARIKWLAELNDLLLDGGIIKPTIMMSWFQKSPTREVCVGARSARASVRAVPQPS